MCSVAQSCRTLNDPMDHSPQGSSVHGIFQARILEWVAISSSRGSSRPSNQIQFSCISCIGRQILYHLSHQGSPIIPYAAAAKSLWSGPTLCDPMDAAHQASPSMGFSRQEHWSRLLFPPPEDLPDPGIKPTTPVSPALQADSLPPEPPRKPHHSLCCCC